MNPSTLKDKIYGSLLGVAAGDAMGMPSSLLAPEEINRLFPDGIHDFLPAPEGHLIHDKMVAGQVTDDTQQTLLLVDLFLETGGFTAESTAHKLIKWAESINAFDGLFLGPSSLRALKMIKEGYPITETGRLGDTNGASMRIAAVGLANPGELNSTITDTAEVCKPTHNTNIAIAGAAGVACAISAAVNGADMNQLIEAFFYGVDKGMQRGEHWTGASIQYRSEWALKLVRSGKREKEIWSNLYNYIGTGVATTEAVPSAIALVAYYEGDPWKVITAAANIGGDCDTVGAIAGGISGAFAGVNAFPKSVPDTIDSVNNLDLESYASRITERVSQAKHQSISIKESI
jgi:ADP-ribosylglycohydrolase